MGVLKNGRCYLSGPIEFDDTGLNWRTKPTNQLKSRFGLNVFDPYADPKQQWVPVLTEARERCDTAAMAKIAKRFVRKDLSMVSQSNMLIAYLPKGVPTTGTHFEINLSNNNKCPTLLVCPDGKEHLPIWYFGFIKPDFMFGSWDDLYSYLEEVDQKKHKDNDRWWFLYNMV